MANNLGFEYVLNVNERATRQNLNTFIRNTFGEGKNAKLSVPIKLDISNSIKDIDFKRIQKDIDDNVGNSLKVKAKIVIDTNNIKNQLTSKIGEIEKDLKFKVGLEIDPSAINLIAGTVDVMKTLNAEIDKVKNNMKELNKNLTINIGDVHLGKQYDEILETSKEIKQENKETEASLEEQLNIQKRILEEKRNQMKQTEKDIKAEKDRLDLAKERKANNDKLIEQEKQLRKEASNLDEQIKAEKDRQKLYEKQNNSLKKQSDEQKKLADDLKKTNEEIKKLENDKASAQQRVNLAKEEEQRRANNLEIMKKENEALKEKLANLQKIANVTNEATTVDKTNKTSKGSSIKQQANDAIKQVTNVSEKRIEQEQKVTKEVEKQSEAQIKAINKVVEAEDKANKAKAKSEKKATSSTSSTKKSSGSKRRNLYEDVQSAEIAKAIHDETVQGVRSFEEEKAEMRRLGDMVANERGLLQQVTECLERNKELTKENADEVQNLLTKLADEKTLIQEAAGNRDYLNYADFKNALKKYQADPSDKNLEKLEWQMEKWGKIGAMYEYRKDVQEAINTLQKQYNIEAQRSLEIEEKQTKINEARTSRATNMQSKAAENKIGFDAKKLKYRDAGSFVKEEMYGFSADELAKAIEKYDDALQPFMDDSGFHIDYGKTDAYIADVKDKVEKLTVAMNNATDTQKIEAYNAKIEKLNKNITILQKTVNTYEHIDALMKMKEGVTFDLGTENKDNTDINKVLNLKEIVSEFAQYSKGVNLAREQTSKMRQDLSWLGKDFDKLIAEKSMDEEKWQSLADKTQQYKKELGVTEDQIRQFINTKNAEIEQGNEHLAKLKELQKTFKRGTNEYRECSKVIKDYNNALENDLPITSTIKDMKELINILDRGKDSFDNFNNNTSNENNVKIVKKQKMSIEELAKQMENQDIMAEKVYLANKKNEKAMIDINQVIDKQRNTWKDLTGEVEKYYSKLSSEEVDKGLSIIRAEDKAEKNPNYRISNYMTKSLNEENLSLKEKISLLAEYEAKSKVLENLKRKVNQVEKYGLSYLEDEEDEIQRLNQKKQEQINKTINHTKATQNNNKALKEQADASKNIAKIDVSQQNKNMQELFKSVALGDNNLENLSNLLKMVRNEVEKFSLVLSSGTGLTDEARKSMYALKESFVQAEKALSIMEQKTSNANFTIEKGSQGFNTQKNKLADLYKEIYNVSESTQQSNQVEEKANQIAEDKVNNTNKVTEAIKQETNAIDEKTLALKSMALQAGIAEEKLDDLLMRIENVIGSGKKLSKTEMTKLAKDFPTEDLASASERRANLISEGRKGKYNQTDEYKQRKGQLDALVANYTDNAFDLFQKIYNEAKNLDKVVEQTNKKVTRTSKPKKQEVDQQNEVTKAVEGTTQAIQEQNETSTKVQDNHHVQMRQAIQDIYNITDAQERFNKMLELTGLNYDELYKKYMNEMKNYTFDEMGIKNDRVQMDKIYTGNINLSQKEAVLSRISYLPEEPEQMTKSNMNLWKKYYAEADVISQVIGSMTKIVDDYNYEAKTAEQLIYQITEKGLNDQLAIEIALRKIEEERLGLLESIERAEKRLAEEKATRKVGTSEEIKALEEELKVLQNNPLYQRYNKAMEEESKRVLKLSNQELTPNNIIQSRFKIEGNLDMDMAYEKAINDFRRTTETLKYYNIKPEEVQTFVALYSKIKEVNGKISDIEYSMQDSHEERILENLRKRLVELDASSKELTSILPKQQEQVQVQRQQTEAILETAQATEKLAKAQEKIKTNILDSDSLNGGNAVNKEHYLPDAAIALMEAQMGTYLKNGKITASFKDYDYEGYDDPRDKMAKEFIVYHERFEELNDVLKRMVAMAISEDDVLNKNDFQALRKQYDRLVNIMETDIRNIIYGLESQGAEPFLKGDFANVEDMLKANPKQAWALSPDDLAQDDANGNKGLLDENIKQLEELIQAQKERAEHERTIRQETKQAEEEVRKELESTKVNLSDIDSVYTRIYESTINAIKASEKFKALSPSSEDFNAIKLLEEDANYAAETGLNEEYWQTLAESAIDSAKMLGVAVDEQEALFQKEIENYNKQIDLMAEQATFGNKITEQKAEQVQQEEKVVKTTNDSVENYKQAYEEVMRLIEASKEYSKLSDDSSEKIDFQDLRDRAETVDDDDVAQWREMYQLSLSLGDEMELNINRERQLAKEKQATLEKTKALLSDGRTTEQYWKDEKEAIEKESLAIEENINAKKEETNATEQLSKAQNEASNKTEEVAKSKDKVTKASRQAKKALDEEKEALIASTNVKDHIEATMKALDKVNKSATFKKKAKEDSTLQDMFNELKREANINKSSGILGIDYWDGLIDRIKIFATEMVKMKAKTIDSAVNPLIYKNSGTTSTTTTTSTSKPLSMEDFKAQQEEKAKQRQIRQQEKNAQKLKDQQEEAKALEIVLKQLEDTITNNPHTQLLKVYEDITKITDAQERFNKILEVTGLNYDEIYQKALKSERTHAQDSGGIDIDEIFTKQLASFNRDNNPYNTLNYMSVANIKGFNDRVDYVAEYRAREKVLQKFINAIRLATDEEKEFIAQQELEIKTLKAYPSEAKKMLDAQLQENTTAQIKETKEEIKELVSLTKEIDINTLKDNLGRTWQQIAEEEKKALSKIKEDMLFYELNNMEMDGLYSSNNDSLEKRYKATNYMDTTNFTAKNKKEAIDLLSEYYAKTLILHQLKQKETTQEQEQAIIIEQETEDIKEQTVAIQEQAKVEEQKQVIDEKSKEIKQEKVKVENEEAKVLQEQIAKNEELIKQEEEAMQDAKETATMHEMEVATINYKIKQAKELRDEQEKQLANANENSEKMKEEYKLQDEGIKRITEKIKALEEEKRVKEQMANDLKQQILQEEALGNVSDDVLNSMIDNYNKLQKEAEDTKKSIDLITTAIKNQENVKTKANLPSSIPTSKPPKNNNNGNNNNNNGGGNGGNNIPPRNNNGRNDGGNIPPDLSEYIKLKQRALMLDIENLVYGKELTDNQKLMVNELVEQVVQLGRSVTSMKELSLEVQKVKQNINETKFDVKVTTTEDKDAKKLLEQQRKEKELMYKGLFDQRIAEIEAEEKYVKEMTSMYAKLFDQAERNAQVEERAKVVLEDKIAKQKELWQLKVKEFSQSDNSNYADPKDITNMKEMADNIGNNVTNMRELNKQLHEMNMAYKEISSNSKNTKAMFNNAEKAREEAEANKEAQKALKDLIATKEEDLRQTHQNIVNGKAYREATDGQRQTFDEFREQLKLTGNSTEEVNRQYKTLVQTMNGMKIDMTTDALRRQDTMFGKLKDTVRQYISLNFDAMDMLRYFTNSVNQAWEHTKVLDEAYTNISMTMNVTNEQFRTMRETAMEVGNANGQLETSVLEMMKVYANAGTTVEEINSQMKATVAFQNVTGLDASAVTQSVQTIIQQYKLTEEGAMSAAEATEYLGDVMVAVAYDLAKEESVAMQEVVAGIETAGNMIKTSGGSFEWFTSVIGTLSEVMNASGSETANAMKMIAARTLKSKEAIDELVDSGENMEDIEIAASNAEKALNSIGLSARTSNGDFKDLEVILGEVAAKWGTLSDATKQYVSEQMAGNNRRSYFIGLMENYSRVEELQRKAENSSGALMEASEKKANSLEGQLNKLQNAWARLYEAMINGSVAKGGVSALTKTINLLAKGLENLHIILPAVTASALVFKAAINGWTVVDQIRWIGMLAKETLTLLISKLGLATAAANGLNLAMLGLKALGIGAIIGVGIYAITNLINKNREAQESFENLSGSVTTLKEELDSLESRETTLANYAQAKQDLQDMVAGTEEYKAKQEELNQLEAEISGYGEQYHSILNNQYLSVEDQIEAMERLIALEEKQAVQEKLDGFTQDTVDNNVSNYNNAIGRARYEQQEIDKLKQEIAEEYSKLEQTKNQTEIEQINERIAQKEREIQQYQEARDENTQAAMEYLEDIENYNALLEEAKAKGIDTDFLPANISETSREQLAELITLLGEVGDKAEETSEAVEEPIKKLGESLDSVFGGDYQADSFIQALDDLNEAMEGTEYTSEEAQDALKSLYKAFPELEGSVNDLGGAIEYLTNQAMLELCEQADQVNSILAEIGSEEFGGFDTSSAQELLSMYPELAGHIQDAAYVQEFLNGKVKEYQDEINGLAETGGSAWKNYYDNVLAQDAEFWNTKLANSEEWAMYEQGIQQAMQQFGAELLGIETQDFADYINAKGGFREVDYSNCQNAAQAEGTLQSSLLSQMLAWYAQYVSDKGGNRQTDMSNVIAFLNTQGAKEAQTVNELKQLWAAYYSAKARAIQAEMADIGTKLSALSSTGIEEEGFLEDGALKHKITKLQGSLKTLQNANTTVQNYFDSVNASFGGVSAGLSQLGAAAKTIGGNIGGGGSGYKPKTASGGSGGRGGSGGGGSKRPSGGSGGRGGSGSGGRGGSGSGGRGGSGSSATEKEVKDLDLRIDKYTELEEAIKRAEEALSRNQEAQEAVTTKPELKKLLEQEIELMNKKKAALEKLKQAQIKEQQSLKSYLQRAGLIFNGDELVGDKVTGGSVTDRLKDAQNWANKASGAEKEWRIKDTQYLKEQIDTYYDLMNSIGSTQGSLNDLNLEIRNAKKEHEELLKAVENLSDRYLQITMRLERLNSELSINQRKQELAVGQELVSLRNRELQILKEKKALNQQNANELKEEQKELQDYLYKAGLRFAKDGTMTNYDQLWAAATKKYNGLAGTAAEDYKEYLDEIAEKTDRYLEILNSELPQVEEDLLDILQTEKELAKQQEEYAEQLRDLAYNYDYLFQVTQKLTKAEQELSLLEAKMEHASYEEKLDLLERQEEIYKSQLKLLQEQKRIQESTNKDRRNDLMKIGFEFDEDGFIKNYDKIVGAMYDKIQSSEGGAVRDEMIEDYDDLIAKVEDYNNSLADIKDSEQAWWEMNNAIKDAQQEQLDLVQEVQDSIKDAITNKWEETTDNLKKELEKQKELLNKQWEEEDWEDELTDAQDELNKIQAQINNLSKDTSLAGQLKLEQLKEDYKKQLEAMNEMIKDHEREMTNQVFEDESQRLDDQMEEALKTEQLMQSVNQALSTGFVTIGEQAIKLNDLLVDQLKEAKELWGDIASLGQAITNKTPSTAQLNSTRKTSSTVNTNAPLINVSITGDLDSRITLDDINRITKQASEDVMVKLYELMK